MSTNSSNPKTVRTTWLTVGEDTPCTRPQCDVVVEAGGTMWFARLRRTLYCSHACRNKHTRLLIQKRRRESDEQKEYERAGKLRTKYGTTPEVRQEMFDAAGGKCEICGLELVYQSSRTGKNKACLDHDHATGAIRGILCSNCNMGIGYFKDDPERLASAISYLHKASAAEAAG